MTENCSSEVVNYTTADNNGNYKLDVNASKVQNSLAEMKGGYNIVAFEDKNGDGKFQQWTPDTKENETTEMGYMLDRTWINFDNWGEFRLNVYTELGSNLDNNNHDYIIMKDSNITVDDMNITVWNYEGPKEDEDAQEDE